ncbi:MAG: sialate O-acetylesterase [Propionibacteriaceae bacterium]|jgi:hypothetical protein|nr:sialate O-acetylesterase [Propionibacteriaceae bacterium]
MATGAQITAGPRDWQIVQQEADGYGTFALAGRVTRDAGEAGTVVARVVDEATGAGVVPWQRAAPDGDTWSLNLRAPAGGLYRIETGFSTTDEPRLEWARRGDLVHHVGVGDLYVIAGQSNAAGYGKDAVYDPPELGLHLLRNNLEWALASHPLNDSTGSRHPVNSEGGNPGHSPYLAFARRLKAALGYPIGLIQTSLGGSALAQWRPEESGELYRNLLAVVAAAGGRVKGVLWYQGCADAAEGWGAAYGDRFAGFVTRLRADLGQPGLPVLTVQLNRFAGPAGPGEDLHWSLVREAQRAAARDLAGVAVVPALDLGLSDEVHNSAAGNLTLGLRLAEVALARVYGRGGYGVPDLAAARRTGPAEVTLEFSPVADRLFDFEVAPEESVFTVTDDAGPVPLASETCVGATIVLGLARPLSGTAAVSALSGHHPRGLPPIDVTTHCPILAFHRAPVLEPTGRSAGSPIERSSPDLAPNTPAAWSRSLNRPAGTGAEGEGEGAGQGA